MEIINVGRNGEIEKEMTEERLNTTSKDAVAPKGVFIYTMKAKAELLRPVDIERIIDQYCEHRHRDRRNCCIYDLLTDLGAPPIKRTRANNT